MISIKTIGLQLLTAVLIFGYSFAALADVTTATDDNDAILAGHDAVAYFTEGKPVKGSTEFTAQYDGAVYRFASAKNRDSFRLRKTLCRLLHRRKMSALGLVTPFAALCVCPLWVRSDGISFGVGASALLDS